jgi:hypothetical protein
MMIDFIFRASPRYLVRPRRIYWRWEDEPRSFITPMVSSLDLLLIQSNVCAGELTPSGDPLDISFETSISCMSGEEKRRFISFVKTILTWRPGDRKTAEELLNDPWLHTEFPEDDDDIPEVQQGIQP